MAVRLSAPRASCPLPPGWFLVLISVRSWVNPQGHSAVGRIRSIERSNDLIGIRTRDLPACSVVPQLTTLPLAPSLNRKKSRFHFNWALGFHNGGYEVYELLSCNAVCVAYCLVALRPWIWRRYVPMKRPWTSTELHGVISDNICFSWYLFAL
jgi:hypothetical protein